MNSSSDDETKLDRSKLNKKSKKDGENLYMNEQDKLDFVRAMQEAGGKALLFGSVDKFSSTVLYFIYCRTFTQPNQRKKKAENEAVTGCWCRHCGLGFGECLTVRQRELLRNK